MRHRENACGNRRTGTAGRAAGDMLRMPRIAARAQPLRVGDARDTELGGIGLAEQNHATGAIATDQFAVRLVGGHLGGVDEVIPEPLGGAHRDPATTMQTVCNAVAIALKALLTMDGATLKARRREKFLEMGREVIC